MIRLALPILAAVVFTMASGMPVAASVAGPLSPAGSSAGSVLQQQTEVDDNDDSRVEVQLTVAAIAVGVVVVLGSAGYLLRKKLGLVAPPPDQTASGHH